MRDDSMAGDSTRAVHMGEERLKFARSLTHPITQTATFTFASLDDFEAFKAGEQEAFEYGRYGNPTVTAAENKLAALDGAEAALLFSTGMSAVVTVLMAMLRAGQHVVIMEDCYRMTVKFCRLVAKFGIECSVVKPDYASIEAAIRPETRMILTESPTNPHLHVCDLEKMVVLAAKHRLKLVIDSTLATPFNQRPLDFGADLVIHSITKYLGGHNDIVGGSVCGKAGIVGAIREFRNIIGTGLDPNSAYLLLRGIKTMGLRLRQQNESALHLARFLDQHAKISKVYYPGLESHPDYAVAKAQMKGFGGLISFEVEGGLAKTRDFIHALEIPYLAPSLGGVESLVSHPATVSYYDMSREERLAINIQDELVRYSVGIEDTDELIADIEQALAKV
jgi:cystathionine gamma-synthase